MPRKKHTIGSAEDSILAMTSKRKRKAVSLLDRHSRWGFSHRAKEARFRARRVKEVTSVGVNRPLDVGLLGDLPGVPFGVLCLLLFLLLPVGCFLGDTTGDLVRQSGLLSLSGELRRDCEPDDRAPELRCDEEERCCELDDRACDASDRCEAEFRGCKRRAQT